MAIDCFDKIMPELSKEFDRRTKGMTEDQQRAEGIKIALEQHKKLFVKLQGFKNKVGQPVDKKYVAPVIELPKPEPVKIGNENYKTGTNQLVGRTITKTIANGEKIKGTYKIVSADDVIASHNEVTFSQSNNFPTNKDGKTVNDRDYQADKNAQSEVIKIAQNLDDRAFTQTPVVSKDGIVLDGNNRTMSRKLASKNGTDTAYTNGLKDQAELYGIDISGIENIKNPMLVFEAEKDMPYTTETFSKFNTQEKKEKSPLEKAVEISKIISERAKRVLFGIYENAETASDVTSIPKKIKELINLFQDEGLLQSNEMPRYFNVEKLTATKEGVAFLENVLLGSALSENIIRTLEAEGMGNIRNKVLGAIVPLVKNSTLKENSLIKELEAAIEIHNEAKATNQSVTDYVAQFDMFKTKNVDIPTMAMAVMLEEAGFKKWLQNYNSSVGQSTFFGITTKSDIADETLKSKIKNYEQVKNNLSNLITTDQKENGSNANQANENNGAGNNQAQEEVKPTANEQKASSTDGTANNEVTGGTTEANNNQAAPAKNNEPSKKEANQSENTDKKGNITVEIIQPKEEKLQDYGEKIGGAKKDLAQKLSDVTTDDISSQPLSKTFPQPDYAKLVADGVISKDGAILLKFLYDNLPTKPRKSYRINSWVSKVQGAIDMFKELVENKGESAAKINQKLYDLSGDRGVGDKFTLFSKVLQGLGFPETNVKIGNYEVKVFTSSESTKYTIVQGNIIIKDFKTLDEAISGLKQILDNNAKLSSLLSGGKETKFSVYEDRKSGDYFIGKKGGTGVVRIMEGFSKSNAAFEFLKTKQLEIQALWEGMKVIPEERRNENNPRVGVDYREGKNVSSEDFAKTFGFRGVEFGNWVDSKERQRNVNEAYDALMDLSNVLGVSPAALSLNGELGFAFGARGSGKFSAHYESDKIVINLTKTRGAGSLAHEWWHGLDNYFARSRGLKDGFQTDNPLDNKNDAIRSEMLGAFRSVMNAINKSKLSERSKVLDRTRSKAYWSTPIEMSARSFENYVIEKLGEQGHKNDYLANFKEVGEWINNTNGNIDALKNYPYPLAEESPAVNESFAQFFDAIKEQTTEQGTQQLFQQGNNQRLQKITPTAYTALLGQLKKAFPRVNVTMFNDGNVNDILGGTEGVKELRSKNGTIYGFVKDGKVYLNEDKINANTPIHEYAHIWQQMLPNSFRQGIELLKMSKAGKALIAKVKANPAYANLSQSEIEAEALVIAIGDKGESVFNESPSMLAKFKTWVSDFFKKIGDRLGIKNLSPDERFEQFTKSVVGDLLGGKEIVQEKNATVKEGTDLMQQPDDKVKAVITELRAQGISDEDIKEFYMELGDSEAEIDALLNPAGTGNSGGTGQNAGQGKNEFSKNNIAEEINNIGATNEDTNYESILHRQDVGSIVETSELAKQQRLILALYQSDSKKLIDKFKDEYKGKYLSKMLSAIKNVNKNNVKTDQIVSIGIALENEIGGIREGFVENVFNIPQTELSKVNSAIQQINKENQRIGSKVLNISKLLYNWYALDDKYSREVMTEDQQKEKDAISDILENDEAIDKAAEQHENGNDEKVDDTKKDDAKPKKSKMVRVVKIKAEIDKELAQLKKDIEDLNC